MSGATMVGSAVVEWYGEPLTAREAMLARDAFIDGSLYYHGPCSKERHADTLKDYVEARYPLPKVERELRVTLSDGTIWSQRPASDVWTGMPKSIYPLAAWSRTGVGGGFTCHSVSDVAAHIATAEDIQLLAAVISGQTEWVAVE